MNIKMLDANNNENYDANFIIFNLSEDIAIIQ